MPDLRQYEVLTRPGATVERIEALEATLSTERLTLQIERSHRQALEAEVERLRAALKEVQDQEYGLDRYQD